MRLMRHRIFVLVSWIVLLVAATGCGTSSKYMTTLKAPQPLAADASAATVVFIRPSGYGGGQKNVIMDEKGRFLGESWGWTYFAVKVPPGEHTFVSWTEGTPALKATLAPGKVYYVEVGATMGAWSARMRLFAIGPQRKQWAELPEWLGKATMLVPNEPAGQAYLQSRDDTMEVVGKGLKNYSEYEGEERELRTLVAGDGVPAPVAATK